MRIEHAQAVDHGRHLRGEQRRLEQPGAAQVVEQARLEAGVLDVEVQVNAREPLARQVREPSPSSTLPLRAA